LRLRLNTLISLLVAIMLVLALGLALWLFNVQLQDTLEEGQAARVTNVAQSVAARDDVRQALVGMTMDFTADNPLQRDIDDLRQRLGVDFIVVMDRHALRLTHPEPARIGQAFRGDDEGPALAGETYSSRAEGSLGTSIRGFAPVLDAQGDVLGAVSVGVTLASLGELLSEHRRDVVVGVLVLMLLTVLGAHLLARYIKRVLLGLEPYEITRLVEERQAMLASVREGVLAVDDQARITLVNPPGAGGRQFHQRKPADRHRDVPRLGAQVPQAPDGCAAAGGVLPLRADRPAVVPLSLPRPCCAAAAGTGLTVARQPASPLKTPDPRHGQPGRRWLYWRTQVWLRPSASMPM